MQFVIVLLTVGHVTTWSHVSSLETHTLFALNIVNISMFQLKYCTILVEQIVSINNVDVYYVQW